eukprot:2471371-Ditylum_brightwellii.AAC.2
MEELERWKDNEYHCRNKVSADDFEVQQKLRCYDQMETQYYHWSGKSALCAVCYSEDEIVPTEEVEKVR